MTTPINPTPNWEKVVLQLKEAAINKKISQKELAKRTGMLQSAISRIFACECESKHSTLVRIADAIGVKIEVIE
jgi:transcriptional regulator with XRE-family HTH domain